MTASKEFVTISSLLNRSVAKQFIDQKRILNMSNSSDKLEITDQLEKTLDPPSRFWGILRQLGPGLIIAGNIVGSGELIATTKTGAQAGIAFLWLIIAGCFIKVFTQIELGRYTLTHGETTLAALNKVPGPRWKINWIVWFWMLMTVFTVGQLGGIVGGVGQSLALTFPITSDYRDAIRIPSVNELKAFHQWEGKLVETNTEFAAFSQDRKNRLTKGHAWLKNRIAQLPPSQRKIVSKVQQEIKEKGRVSDEIKALVSPSTNDDKIWATIIAMGTSVLLYFGRYGFLQNLSIILVVSFSLMTIGNVISLQMQPDWSLSMAELFHGFSFSSPILENGKNSWETALATFGIIGVGASELIAYPYWCLEKGYARYTGQRNDSDAWATRAQGWLRVMHYDVFASMLIYTIATVAFFLMGVTVLHRQGLDPDGMRMVSTLAEAYIPIFGLYAKWFFLAGAIAVLYSTFLLANAAQARLVPDWLILGGFLKEKDEEAYKKGVTIFSVLLPLLCLAVYLTGVNPVKAVLVGGIAQAVMLPILGLAAIYFRYKKTDERLQPGSFQSIMLILSFIGFLIAGAYSIWSQIERYLMP